MGTSLAEPLKHAWLGVLLGATLLMIPALLNGFPFIFPDSGDYLTLKPQLHRAPFYGLFITFFHLNQFIWAPIIMQAVVVSHLLWLLYAQISVAPAFTGFLLRMAGLTACSSLPFFTGFIMADIFTPIMFVCMYLLCFHFDTLARWQRLYLFLLGCVATATHISNLSLGVGLLALFATLFWLTHTPIAQRLKPLACLLGILTLTALTTLLYNVVLFNNWAIASAGQSFWMANLIEHGPARRHIAQACPKAGYKLCAYATELPDTANELLWSSGIFQKLGGFTGMKEEAATIVHRTLAERPGEVLTMIGRNFVAGFVTHEPAAEFYRNQQVPSFTTLLATKFGADAVAAFESSAEMRDAIPHSTIRMMDSFVFPLSFLLLGVVAIRSYRRKPEHFTLAVAILCFFLGNTLLCTALSGVHDRYQSRITWLAPMAVMMLWGNIRQRETR